MRITVAGCLGACGWGIHEWLTLLGRCTQSSQRTHTHIHASIQCHYYKTISTHMHALTSQRNTPHSPVTITELLESLVDLATHIWQCTIGVTPLVH